MGIGLFWPHTTFLQYTMHSYMLSAIQGFPAGLP